MLGIVPTLLAVVRLARAARAARCVRRDPPRLLVSLLPLAGIAGYLFFTVSYPTPDGDVLKPTYMLTTLGAWALCFAWLATTLGSARPRLVYGTLAVIAVLDLPFVVYKGGVGLLLIASSRAERELDEQLAGLRRPLLRQPPPGRRRPDHRERPVVAARG